MKQNTHRGFITQAALAAGALFALASFLGFVVIPTDHKPVTEIALEPTHITVNADDTFTVNVVVRAGEPTNVFAGEVFFDAAMLKVTAIDYNTSIAELWAETPWYSNGAGTLNFAGGTIQPGGFVGEGTLLSITFTAHTEGAGAISMHTASILLHDGLGTETPLAKPFDTLVTVQEPPTQDITTRYTVHREPPTTDLNGDGKQNLIDVSIFMLHLAGNDVRYDFTMDGVVDLRDLTFLLTQ